jgi:hypothetical protein
MHHDKPRPEPKMTMMAFSMTTPKRWPGCAKATVIGMRNVDQLLIWGRIAIMVAITQAMKCLRIRCQRSLGPLSPQRETTTLRRSFAIAVKSRVSLVATSSLEIKDSKS